MIKAKPRRSLKSIVFKLAVFFLLGLSNVLIKLMSFKSLVRLISNSELECHAEVSTKTVGRILYIKQTIASVSRRTPWRSMCFETALTAGFILKMLKIPHSIYFGLNNDQNVLKAHAWLKVNDMYVTGYSAGVDYTVVSAYHYISEKDRVLYV